MIGNLLHLALLLLGAEVAFGLHDYLLQRRDAVGASPRPVDLACSAVGAAVALVSLLLTWPLLVQGFGLGLFLDVIYMRRYRLWIRSKYPR
jgi:hypothetical protein